MSQETFYLELSEGAAHKFYEVVVDGTDVTIRFGRIGDPGQAKTTTHATAEKALADAQKKVAEKVRKGYERAVRGVRQKRTVTRRPAHADGNSNVRRYEPTALRSVKVE